MTDTLYTINVNLKTQEQTPDVAVLGKSIQSTADTVLDNGSASLVVASKENSDYHKAPNAFFRIKLATVHERPVDAYADVRDAVRDEHPEDIVGWGFNVQEEFNKAEKEDTDD